MNDTKSTPYSCTSTIATKLSGMHNPIANGTASRLTIHCIPSIFSIIQWHKSAESISYLLSRHIALLS